jgi:hypothetical protein
MVIFRAVYRPCNDIRGASDLRAGFARVRRRMRSKVRSYVQRPFAVTKILLETSGKQTAFLHGGTQSMPPLPRRLLSSSAVKTLSFCFLHNIGLRMHPNYMLHHPRRSPPTYYHQNCADKPYRPRLVNTRPDHPHLPLRVQIPAC